MKTLIDTNVILDVLCAREPFVKSALTVFRLCETGRVTGCVSALSVPNIVYIMRKQLDRAAIGNVLRILTGIFSIIDLKEHDLLRAAELGFGDYEDAIQCVCANRINADYIVTRNKKDYTDSPIPAITPDEFLQIISAKS